MKQIEKNLLLSARVLTEEAESLNKIVQEKSGSLFDESRITSIHKKISLAQGFIKALKMIICNHDTDKGCTTGVMYQSDYKNYSDKIPIRSVRVVTKRCHYCNQIFHRKKYNLRKKKK